MGGADFIFADKEICSLLAGKGGNLTYTADHVVVVEGQFGSSWKFEKERLCKTSNDSGIGKCFRMKGDLAGRREFLKR